MSEPELDGQVQTACEEDVPILPLPATPCNSTSMADPAPEELPSPVPVETDQSSQSLEDLTLLLAIPLGAGSGTFQSEGHESVAMNVAEVGVFKGKDTLDTVDGWKERENKKMMRKDMVSLDDTPSTVAEEEECQQSRNEPDDTHTLQIQRERDVFCPEPSTVSTCTDLHPEKGQRVSQCLLQKDEDGGKFSAALDDSIFKRPKDPPPVLDTGTEGCDAFSPSEGALSGGRPDTVAPRSSRLSWKSETEDRGGGMVEKGPEEEEEEKKDQLSESPVYSAISRASARSLSPLRRHSWEPARNNPPADMDLTQRSISWCPSNLRRPDQEQIDSRSYSLEGLEGRGERCRLSAPHSVSSRGGCREECESGPAGEKRLPAEEQEGEHTHCQPSHQALSVTNSCPVMFPPPTLTKSISMVTISQRELDGGSSFCPNSGSLEYSISEDEPGPLRSDIEGKGGPKISRTFSYLRSKMSKKGKPSPVPEAAPGSAVSLRTKSTSSASSISSASSSSSRERWSTATTPEDQLPTLFPRRHNSIFNPHSNLSKSISTSNIAGLDVEVPLKGLKSLSQSTDSLHKGSKVNASTESLTDEGTEMMDSQLMGEFEWDVKDLEADSWSGTMDKKFLKTLKKDEIKKQDVIYELYQTEFHHVRTLRIMSEIFPVLDDLLETHTHFLTLLLERKKASSTEGEGSSNFLICSIGDVLLNKFSGCSADRMKKVYGKFCSRHSEAVNLYKDLHAKDKRFQGFIKKTMSSSIVRRLSIPECILLITQRITKYPVLIQRILQHTKGTSEDTSSIQRNELERVTACSVLQCVIDVFLCALTDSDEDHSCVCEALRCVKELITAVDSKVNEHGKKQRLKEVYSKSIMRMKSGQMFAREDLMRGRKLLHDGALQLKNTAGRLKDVQAMLLSDVLVFLQEKDQKYAFASLSLIVREVANEERGQYDHMEPVSVALPHHSWDREAGDGGGVGQQQGREEHLESIHTGRYALHGKTRTRESPVRQRKTGSSRRTEQRRSESFCAGKTSRSSLCWKRRCTSSETLATVSSAPDGHTPVRERMLFMATPDDVTKGEPIIKDALREVESLHAVVSSGVGGAGCSAPVGLTGGAVGPVCLPRRAETFGGFDSHQMNSSKRLLPAYR
ncbi:hypothetical protein F7725_022206 [Dissostichus mawsoni]|uniref:DH domain-containing protein n=1 Tax=Dissostichus mawsoni TaxID=36200 RepID=A0A7J5YZC1_DISMA|nr:hypothetical protein F7725_022206 [Dissostichus mawsoni]